jgi:mono/diheme cytochrome c family protein
MSRRRAAIAAVLVVAASAAVAACGEEGISLSSKHGDSSTIKRGAQLFSERCSGCHTLSAAGTQGSNTSVKYQERTDGPNLDQRREQVDQVLYAIRNGGFSGAIMPQNIVVGQDAQDVAQFVAAYAGVKAKRPPSPTTPTTATGAAKPQSGGSASKSAGSSTTSTSP